MERTLTDALLGGIGSAYDRVRDRIIVAEWHGRLLAVDLHGDVTVLGTGYRKLESVALSDDGTWALVTERGGALLRVDLDDADRSRARVLTDRLRAPHQVVLVERRHVAYVVEHAAAGRLVAVGLAGGSMRAVAEGLDHAVGLALTQDERTAYVTEQATGDGRLVEFALSSGQRSTLAAGLTQPFFLSWADEGQTALLVPERDPANRLLRIERRAERWPVPPEWPRIPQLPWLPRLPGRPDLPWDRRVPTPVPARGRRGRRTVLLDGLDARPSSALTLGPDRIAVTADRTLVIHDLSPVPVLRVDLDLGPDALFVGAYRRVPVRVIGSGASFDDLAFEVVEGPHGGQVSYSRDETFDPTAPEIMLLAGYRPGTYTLRATRAVTGEVLGEERFEVGDLWTGADGPSRWFEGISQPATTGAAWGGGASGPQNIDVSPALGTRRVAVVLVDTATARYPADSSAIIQEWRDEVADGVPGGVPPRSSRAYFQEVSAGAFDLDLDDVYGPIQLSGDFEDYFALNAQGLWGWRAGFWQSVVTAADDLIDYTDIDSLVAVVRAAPAVDPSSPEDELNHRRFAWPYAGGGTFSTAEGSQSMAVVTMAHDWGDGSSREIHETLSHELGHNLGPGDLYMDAGFGALEDRDVGSWDLMSWDGTLAHMSTPNKMRLGWIRADWVRAYDFAASGAVDDVVTLHASELGAPPDGRFSAVEVRLADGWNYYFEYRAEQSGAIGDQQLPADRRVVGTDVVSPDYTAPVRRPAIVLLPDDPDGDGPVLGVGRDYEETDVSDPMFPTDFSVEVLSTDGDSARIRIRYGVNSKPDPSIRPWPGHGVNAWQSPDIEVRNAQNAADATLANLPWAGHPNTIVAKVKNAGSLRATGVQVNFSVKDFTVGGGAETPLGLDVRDIPVGDTVEFSFDGWVPPADGHYCVVARMPLHVEPGPPTIVEMTELNNLAQSNYTEFISAEASPPRRQRTTVTVGNPYSRPTRALLTPTQTNPFYRTYVGQTLVNLDAGEEREVEIMFEALHGTPDADRVLEHDPRLKDWLIEPNYVAVAGLIEDPDDPQLHAPLSMGGVVVRVRTGTGTRVTASADGNTVYGKVSDAHGRSVQSGTVLVTVRERGRPETERAATGTVSEGAFGAEFRDVIHGRGFEATATYLGDGPWAPSPEHRFTT